jgi:hypothetical protein
MDLSDNKLFKCDIKWDNEFSNFFDTVRITANSTDTDTIHKDDTIEICTDPMIRFYEQKYWDIRDRLKDRIESEQFNSLSPFCRELFVIDYTCVGIATMIILLNRIYILGLKTHTVPANKINRDLVIYSFKLLSYHFACGMTEITRDYLGSDLTLKLNLFNMWYYVARLLYLIPSLFAYLAYGTGLWIDAFVIGFYVWGICIDSIHHILNLLQYTLLAPIFGGYFSIAKVLYHLTHWVALVIGIVEPFYFKIFGLKHSLAVRLFVESEVYNFFGHALRKICQNSNCCT